MPINVSMQDQTTQDNTLQAGTLHPWYVAGLHFECVQCGNCCSGPEQGYIWAGRPEIELMADFLQMSPQQLQQQHLKRVGLRTTIIEQLVTKDCVFLRTIAGLKKCMIYPVRPSQCRTWPFWPGNLASPADWNRAATRCPGINRGKLYAYHEIQAIRKSSKWWRDPR